LLSGRANHCIAFPVVNLGSSLNGGWALTHRPSAHNLTSTLKAARRPFLAFLFEAQLLAKIATSSFIGVDIAVNRSMANIDLIGNLDGAPPL
jgi:hypothetical protein